MEGIGDERQTNRNTNDSVLNTHSNREINLLEIIFLKEYYNLPVWEWCKLHNLITKGMIERKCVRGILKITCTCACYMPVK